MVLNVDLCSSFDNMYGLKWIREAEGGVISMKAYTVHDGTTGRIPNAFYTSIYTLFKYATST
jgi:hypothetical protein